MKNITEYPEVHAKHVHVIPVPAGMLVIEAWYEIITMGRLVEPNDESCEWAVINCNGQKCADVDFNP